MANLPSNPGEALWVGSAGGKNHYNVGIGGPNGGTDHTDHSQSDIEDGFSQSPEFVLNSDGDVQFRMFVEYGRTSTNTKYPRSELREFQPDGTTRAAWNSGSGTHTMQGRSRIDTAPAAKPWVVFFQCHDADSDLARVQLENGSIVCRRTPPGGSEIRTVLRTGYVFGTWIDWEMRFVDGRMTITLDGVVVLDAGGMGTSGCFFKAGCYNQVSDTSEGGGATPGEYCQVTMQRGSFVTWHTGYAQPTEPIFTGATDPSGGPGGGAGNDTQPPTVPPNPTVFELDQALRLEWGDSTDNVGVDLYNIYRFDDSSGGGGGSTATLGRTTGGGSSTASSADKLIASSAVASASGTLTEGHARLWLSATGSTTSRMLVYADSSGAPGALLATSDEITVTATTESIRDYTFSGANQITITSGTTYWIGVAWDDPGTPSVTYSRDTLSSQRLERSDITYGTFPDPFGTPTGTFAGPIDAWLVTSTGGGGSTTNLGKSTDGGSSSASSGNKTAVSTFTASASGTLTEGHARAWLSATGSANTKVVVYADSAGEPGAKLAESDVLVVTATAEALQDYVFSGANQITITSGTAYWIGLAWQDPGTPSLNISRDGTASGRREVNVYAPDPFGTPTVQSGPVDVYVEVTSAPGFVLIATTASTTYTDTGLTNDTEYAYTISAEDAAGNESAQTAVITGTPRLPDTEAPSVPGSLTATPGDKRVTLAWTASTDNVAVSGYRVYRSVLGTPILVATVTGTAYTDNGLVNGTAYTYTVSAVDAAGNESAATSGVAAAPSAPPLEGVEFLRNEFGEDIRLEVQIAWGADLAADSSTWEWTDITTHVRTEPGISTSLGRNDESSTSNPASLSLVLDNSGGDYSLGGQSPNWPHVRRNTPVRVRVDPGDAVGPRTLFFGYADGFTPGWDSRSGRVPVVSLSASGVLRRLAQGNSPIQSAYRRTTTGASSVVAYWPLEEGSSARFAPAVRGGSDFTIVGRPDWEADDSFDCSAALPAMKDAVFNADVTPYTDTGENQVRFLLVVPELNGPTGGAVLIHISTTGTIIRWDIVYSAVDGVPHLSLFRYNNDGTLHSSSLITFTILGDATPVRLSLEMTQNGSDIAWTLGLKDTVDAYSAGFFVSDTITGKTVGIVSHIEINPHGGGGDTVFGHVTVENDITSQFSASNTLVAHAGETPTDTDGRLARLAAENDLPLTVYGVDAGPDPLGVNDQMGPQLVGPLLELLRECETVDQGQLWDGRDAGLSYTTRRRREDGTTRLTIDALSGELAGEFDPVDDDQRNLNRAVVSRKGGVVAEYEDVTGPLGTATIGIYDSSLTVNNWNDSMAGQYAAWLVHLGTAEGYRYPSVSLNLHAAPHLIPAVLDIVPGERVDVTNLDDTLDWFPDGTVSLIVEGVAHELVGKTWTATFKCSPFSPWGVGRAFDEVGDTNELGLRADTDGAELAAAAMVDDTSLSVATPSGPLWTTDPDDYPLVLSVGGIPVRATACSGTTSPQTFTVDPLPYRRAAGSAVALWDSRPLGLG